MVAGISPRRALDAEYETFFELVREHVAAAIANALAILYADQERVRLRSFQEAPTLRRARDDRTLGRPRHGRAREGGARRHPLGHRIAEEDGYSLISRVRAMARSRGGATPAACLTGYTSSEDRREALTAGFNMHLAKPVEPSELIAVVANLGRMAKTLRSGD